MILNEYEIRFKYILETEMQQHQRGEMLATLMSDMESYYQIPEIVTQKWGRESPGACTLYLKIARSRIMIFEE